MNRTVNFILTIVITLIIGHFATEAARNAARNGGINKALVIYGTSLALCAVVGWNMPQLVNKKKSE
jgi:predicted tellurium resistance membrane protein TerC